MALALASPLIAASGLAGFSYVLLVSGGTLKGEHGSAIVTEHQATDRNAKFAYRGQMFRDLLPKVGLANLRDAAQFLGISMRQAQRIAAGTHAASTAASKLLALMHDTQTPASEFSKQV